MYILCNFNHLMTMENLDRKGILCASNYGDEKVFFFNRNKAYRLEMLNGNENQINDEMAKFIKDPDLLGSDYKKKANLVYWGRNIWNGYYTYVFDTKNLLLKERYIIKRSGVLGRIISKFSGSEYYRKELTLQCNYKSWFDIEDYFKEE